MNSQSFRVLVVDDDETVRNLYVDVFREAKFQVDEAKDGLEGLEKANTDRPDLIFTGIIMPRMDGFALVEHLRKSVVTAGVPVVFSSHLGRQEDRERAKSLGVKDFIVLGTTPVSEVVRRVSSLLENNEYFLDIDSRALDAQKLAQDLGINLNYLCSENGGQKLALKLRVKDISSRTFEAELVCI